MRKICLFLGFIILSAMNAQSAPTQQQSQKWGAYAIMADVGWWQALNGMAARYSWLVPNERMQVEYFFPDGTLMSQ